MFIIFDVHITIYFPPIIENRSLVNNENIFIGYLIDVTSDVQNKDLLYCL